MEQAYTRLLNGTTEVSTILRGLDKYKFNPSGIQRVILDHLAEVTDGKVDIVDPTNPFVFLLESSCVNTANFIIQNTANTRRQYPAAAQTYDDVYIHMSDVDFLDRFAIPATTKFSIMVEKQELIENLVPVPGTNTKKLQIPRNTEFKINDTVFSLQYPVDIIQYDHGGFQVLYDNSKPSPLYSLSTNVVHWEMRTLNKTRQDWLYIEVDVHQFKIDSSYASITVATGFKQDYSFNDQFYYARVFNRSIDTSGLWKEIKTTHTDQVYNPITPTAVLKVTDNNLEVSIPQIYLNNGKIRGTIRVDIYETKGEINMIMENYLSSAFETEWRTIDTTEVTLYSAPLSALKTIFGFSKYSVNSGRDGLTFEALRERVINNSIGGQQIPITNVQIESSLSNQGFSVVKNVDVLTNRIFLASRPLPKPIDEKLITAGSASIETLIVSLSDLRNHPKVRNNEARVTLVPELIYSFNNGITKLLDNNEMLAITNAVPSRRAEIVNTGKYFYTPFHYVLDSSMDEFEVRPYFLDKPQVQTVTFIEQNNSTGLQINTLKYSVQRSESGYILKITAEANKNVKAIPLINLRCYLSFIPAGETSRAFLMSNPFTLDLNGNLVIQFNLSSNFDIDTNDNISFTPFKMVDRAQRSLFCGLTKDFDLIYSTVSGFNSNAGASTIDDLLNQIPSTFDGIVDDFKNSGTGITHEKIRVKFGDSLKTLWARSRSVVSASPYETYTTNSPKTYQEDVYNIDPVTGSAFTIDSQGRLIYNIKHQRGDVVRDDRGNVVFNYKIGDIRRDATGKPIPMDPNRIVRQIDIAFIDAAYYYATDLSSNNYRKQMTDTVVNWLMVDIANISKNLLEQTKLYFYPKTNMGTIKVLADNALVTNIEASQYFNIRLFVNFNVFNNALLKSALTKAAIKILDELLNKSVVSISNIIINLMEQFSEDVISVSVSGLGGTSNYETVSILSENERCSIRKKLSALPNGNLIVEEDVNISFILHENI